MHTFLWRDVEVLGDAYPAWTRFLWDSSPRFQIVEPFARFARDGLPPDATIFGDPTLADAVALRAGKRVALDEADTNFMRFASGVTPPESFIARLRAAPPAFVLFSIGEYSMMGDAFHELPGARLREQPRQRRERPRLHGHAAARRARALTRGPRVRRGC